MITWGPPDLDVLEYAGVRRKSSLNQVKKNSRSTPLVNQACDSKEEISAVLKKWLQFPRWVKSSGKKLRAHKNQTQ